MADAPTPAPAAGSSAPAPAPASGSASASSAAPKKKTTKKKATAAKASGAGTQAKTKKPTQRKKKAPSKASSAANQQAILQDARAAASDLAQQRANAAARKADPLWYRMEDVVPAVLTQETQTLHPIMTKKAVASMTLNPSMNEQVQILERALQVRGMTRADVTPQAMACLLEYQRKFTLELLRDAQDYADMVNRTELTRADLMLASDLRQDNPVAVSTQLPLINQMAQTLNRKPLPPIPANCYSGILLPPPEHQLTARTFDVVSGAVAKLKASSKFPEPPTLAAAGGGASLTGSSSKKSGSNKSQPSYGASRGRQIPVKLNTTASGSTNTASAGSSSSNAAAGDSKAGGGAKPMDTSA